MAGRPREFDKEQALAQAMRVFWQHGYEGTSMSTLVAALGLASARIYAAFGSKQQLFEAAVALYEAGEGGFAERAFEQPAIADALRQLFCDAVQLYTDPDRPGGCLVVSAANSVAAENAAVLEWLAQHRRQRTQSIIARLQVAQAEGQLEACADVQALGDFYATFLHGVSIQGRDGVSREALLQAVEQALKLLPVTLR